MQSTVKVKPRELPIGFKPHLRQAILNTNPDRSAIDPSLPIKWVTRRLLNPRTSERTVKVEPWIIDGERQLRGSIPLWIAQWGNGLGQELAPKYQVGDRLYLLELTTILSISNLVARVEYEDGASFLREITAEDHLKLTNRKDWRKPCNQRFMLKSFARHWVQVTAVRCEHLQDISEEQAIGEGVERRKNGWKCYGKCPEHANGYDQRTSATASFMSLWNSIHSDYPWDNNPIVWVYEFHRAEPTDSD
jgi:hypothetical protein